MNCDKNYFENEDAEREPTKGKPVTGRVSKRGSTQSLQECVGRLATLRSLVATDRQTLGQSRIVRRRDKRPKQKRGE